MDYKEFEKLSDEDIKSITAGLDFYDSDSSTKTNNALEDLKNNLATCLAYDSVRHGADRPSINHLKSNIHNEILNYIEGLKKIHTKHELNYSIGEIQGMITVLSATEIISPEFETAYQRLAYEVFINCGNRLSQPKQKDKQDD